LNFWIHFQLSRLRDDTEKERKIPQGFWFNFVSFPNYFFEILIWVAFNVMTHTVAGKFLAIFLHSRQRFWIWIDQKTPKFVICLLNASNIDYYINRRCFQRRWRSYYDSMGHRKAPPLQKDVRRQRRQKAIP
jgi:hypothetical protein